MPNVEARADQNFVQIDDGVVVRPGSHINVDTTRPLAKAAIEAGTLIVLDAAPAPGPLASDVVIRFGAISLAEADGLLQPNQFALWLDPKAGATKFHVVAKDEAGTLRQGEIALV